MIKNDRQKPVRHGSRSKKTPVEPRKPATPAIDPHIRKEITVIVLTIGAIIIFLGLIDSAGPIGYGINRALTTVFGINKFLVPIIGLGMAAYLARPDRFRLTTASKVGLILLLVSWGGLINLLILKDAPTMLETERLAHAGGYAGLLTSYPILRLADFWAAFILLVGLIMASLILTFNVTVRDLTARLKTTATKIRPFPANRQPDSSVMAQENVGGDAETAAKAGLPIFSRKSIPTNSEKGEREEKTGKADDFSPLPPQPKKMPPIAIPTGLLDGNSVKPTAGDIQGRMVTIKKTLENFGIPVEMGEVSVGPTVTQFTLKPADGIKLTRITALSNDLAMALAAHPIRIEAPIPGKPMVGIEVPNKGIAVVGLREILESVEFRTGRKSSLTICLGKDVSGKPWVADLGKMPHMLVAGATGSGKTVCLNTVILSLLYQNGPDTLRLLLIDPKRVELPVYNGIPHMLVPAVTEVPKIINALKWCIEEMDRRFTRLSETGCRDIGSYNKAMRDGEKMPYIVVVIDELADLMVASASEVEASIIRLAQMARAVGIHLVIATQRPSVDVITGLIKANVTSRIAFSVASATDSRTILDTMGAEKLVGRGDSLFQTPELSKPRRIQCCYISDSDIRKVVDFIVSKTEEPVDYLAEITEKKGGTSAVPGGFGDDSDDELLDEAKATVVQAGKASASYLQRRLKIGYARAARLLDLLEEQGVIGPGDGAKPRQVLANPVHDEDGYHLPDGRD